MISESVRIESYLSAEQRRLALRLSAGLRAAAAAFAAGERAAKSLVISRADFQPVETASAGDLIALAVFAGRTRLIDNLVLGEAE